jgi:hypothetical protein
MEFLKWGYRYCNDSHARANYGRISLQYLICQIITTLIVSTDNSFVISNVFPCNVFNLSCTVRHDIA